MRICYNSNCLFCNKNNGFVLLRDCSTKYRGGGGGEGAKLFGSLGGGGGMCGSRGGGGGTKKQDYHKCSGRICQIDVYLALSTLVLS